MSRVAISCFLSILLTGCIGGRVSYELAPYPQVVVYKVSGTHYPRPWEEYEYQIWIGGHPKHIRVEVWTNPALGAGLDQLLKGIETEVTGYNPISYWIVLVRFPGEGGYYLKVKTWNKFDKDTKFYHVTCRYQPGYEQPEMPPLLKP